MRDAPSNGVFDNFTIDQWEDWIARILLREPIDPPLEVLKTDILHLSLSRLYSQLESQIARDRFSRAILSLLEHTPTSSVERLYTLLQLIVAVKCQGAKRFLSRMVRDETYLGLEFGGQDLHYLAVAVRGEFEVDDEFADYLRRSARRISDFRYSLLVFYVLSAKSGSDVAEYIAVPLSSAKSRAEKRQLANVLLDVIERVGSAPFYEWQSAMRDSGNTRVLQEFHALLRSAAKWADIATEGGFGMLLAAEAWSGHREFTARDIVHMASTVPEVGESRTRSTLATIWKERPKLEKPGQSQWWLGGLVELDAGRVFKSPVPELVLRVNNHQHPLDARHPEAALLEGILLDSELKDVRSWS